MKLRSLDVFGTNLMHVFALYSAMAAATALRPFLAIKRNRLNKFYSCLSKHPNTGCYLNINLKCVIF